MGLPEDIDLDTCEICNKALCRCPVEAPSTGQESETENKD